METQLSDAASASTTITFSDDLYEETTMEKAHIIANLYL